MKYSERLRKAAQPILQAQYEHPFVKGLKDGTLPLDKFRFYMIQDSLYVVDYAKAIAWVATQMPDVKNILAMLDTAKESFQIEAMLKEQYFEQFGITMEEALKAEIAPTCKGYLDHLHKYAKTGTLAEGMSAILPCGWVYVEIGVKFTSGIEIPDDHPYKSWLMTYAVPELQDMVNWWFDILDSAVDGLPEKELGHIQDIFIKSCQYEHLFWDMGWKIQGWSP